MFFECEIEYAYECDFFALYGWTILQGMFAKT
jgi:hypothetical protein